MPTQNAWTTLALNLALIGAVTALGLKHVLDSQSLAGLLGALAGGHLVVGSGAVSNLLASRRQNIPPAK